MTEVYKTLASGLANSSPQVLYTVPTGKQAIVKRIGAVPQTAASLRLWAGTSPITAYIPTAASEWWEWEGTLTLGAGDNIQLQGPSVSAQVDYVVSGVEITP